MQDRWISYIFRYKENRKCENAGFVKIIRTSKGSAEEARVEIGIKLCKPIMCRCRVFLIYEGKELVLMEELLVKPEERDVISIKKSLKWEDFLKNGCTPRDFDGVFFAVDDGDTLMSLWKDKEIKISALQTGTAMRHDTNNSGEEPLQGLQVEKIDTIPIPDYLMQVQNNLNYDKPAGAELFEDTEELLIEEISIEEKSIEQKSTDHPTTVNSTLQDISSVEPSIKSSVKQPQTANSIEALIESSIKLPQFIDSPFKGCVKIVPQDIGKLPMGNWKLGQNSFLTHGYYKYKYIMLGEIKLDTRETYIIGVPGVYTNKEKYLANMFGFGLFIPVRRSDVKTGSFGYWVWEIVRE